MKHRRDVRHGVFYFDWETKARSAFGAKKTEKGEFRP
ncbi:unnamed protein product, partial [marine sediment metagenome]